MYERTTNQVPKELLELHIDYVTSIGQASSWFEDRLEVVKKKIVEPYHVNMKDRTMYIVQMLPHVATFAWKNTKLWKVHSTSLNLTFDLILSTIFIIDYVESILFEFLAQVEKKCEKR